MKLRVIEFFAGIGACSTALKRLGIEEELLDAVEIDKYAIKSFNAMHGTNFETQDITQWDKDFEDVDLIMHGSPCFLKGELVNTSTGYKPIEKVEVGDYVVSHDGSVNKVIQTMQNKNNWLFDITCAASNKINTTHNHPFYVLRDGEKQWVNASDLTLNDYLCIPKNKENKEVEWNGSEYNYNNHPVVSNNLPLKDNRFWYVVGRFIGDGWVYKRKERNNNIAGIRICCAKDELEDLKQRIGDVLEYNVAEDRTTYKLQFFNKELGEFCAQFGLGASNKFIPKNILDINVDYLGSLLDGITDSDGSFTQGRWKITTVSKKLAYSIGQLVLKVNNVPYHIYKDIRPNKHVIEGRIVNQKNTYQVVFANKYNKQINFVDEDYLYSRIRKIEDYYQDADVYNLEVENTHTYCVENIAVHNCQDISLAGLQKGADEGSGTRSSLMYETLRIVGKLKPKYVVWENVKNLVSQKHFHNFKNYLDRMEELGYINYWKVLNSKDYGIPQNRERVFTISIRKDIAKTFEFPQPIELKLKLKDMLEDNVDEKYYLSEKQMVSLESGIYKSAKVSEKVRKTAEGICPTLDTMQGGNRQPFVEVENPNSLAIKNATKQGYLLAHEGDGVNIDSRMKWQRGNVQPESIQTLTTSGGNSRGVVVACASRKRGDEHKIEISDRDVANCLTTISTDSMVASNEGK